MWVIDDKIPGPLTKTGDLAYMEEQLIILRATCILDNFSINY